MRKFNWLKTYQKPLFFKFIRLLIRTAADQRIDRLRAKVPSRRVRIDLPDREQNIFSSGPTSLSQLAFYHMNIFFFHFQFFWQQNWFTLYLRGRTDF